MACQVVPACDLGSFLELVRLARIRYHTYASRQRAIHMPKISTITRVGRIARAAIKRGEITRRPCESCGSSTSLVAHHDDYRKPRVVRFLCRPCHRQHHLKKTPVVLGSRRKRDFRPIDRSKVTREAITLYESGQSMSEVAARFGVTRERIRQCLGAWGVRSRKRTKSRRVIEANTARRIPMLPREAVEAIGDPNGPTIVGVARTLGVSVCLVQASLSWHGIDAAHKMRKLKPADIPRIRELRMSGMFYKDIAAAYGVTPGMIGHIIAGRELTKY